MPEDCLEELKQYTEEQCLIEVLKYWLRNHYGRPTWQEVEKVQEKVKTYMQKNANQGKICDIIISYIIMEGEGEIL